MVGLFPLSFGNIAVTSDSQPSLGARIAQDVDVGLIWGRAASFTYNVEDPTDKNFDPTLSVDIKDPDKPIERTVYYSAFIGVSGYTTTHSYLQNCDVATSAFTPGSPGIPPTILPTDPSFYRENSTFRLNQILYKFCPSNAFWSWSEPQPKKRIDQFTTQFKHFIYDLTFQSNRTSSFWSYIQQETGDASTLDHPNVADIDWAPCVSQGGVCQERPPSPETFARMENCISPGGYGALIPFGAVYMPPGDNQD